VRQSRSPPRASAPAAGSRLRDRKASSRLTADLPSRRITQVNARVPLRQDHVDAPAVTERLHKIRCGVGAAMRAVTGNRPPRRQRFHCALMGVKGCGARCRFTPSNVGHRPASHQLRDAVNTRGSHGGAFVEMSASAACALLFASNAAPMRKRMIGLNIRLHRTHPLPVICQKAAALIARLTEKGSLLSFCHGCVPVQGLWTTASPRACRDLRSA